MTVPDIRLLPRRAAGVAAGSLVLALLPASDSPVVGLLGVAFLVAWTVVVPGWALGRLIGVRGRDPLDAAALWIVHGLFVAMTCAFVWALAGWTTTGFGLLSGVATALLVLAAPAADPTRVSYRRDGARGERFLRYCLAGLLVLVCTSVYVAGPPLDFGKDTLDYIAYVDEVAETGEAFPVTAFYDDPGADGTDLRKALLHSLYGFYRARSGIDTVRLFAALAALMLAAAALLVHSAARRMLGDGAAGALAAIVFVLCFDQGPASSLIRAWFYPSRFGFAVLLVVTAAATALYRCPSARRAALCAIYAFTAATIHVQYTVLSCAVVAILLAGKICAPPCTWREHVRRAVPAGVAVVAGVLPFGFFRFLTAYEANELHSAVQGAVFVFGSWFVVDPLFELGTAGLVILAAILAIVPLWRLRRENAGVGYVIAAVLAVALVQYNPVVLTPLYGAVTYLVFRLDQAAPYVLLPAFLIVSVARGRRRVRLGTVGVLAVAVTLAALVAGIVSMPAGFVWGGDDRDARNHMTHLRWRDGLAELDSLLPAGSVVASDPVTSYAITAFTRHRVVSTLGQHAPPNDSRLFERTQAARDILSPFTPAATKVARLREFGATHIVVNENLPAGMTYDIWVMEPDLAAQSKLSLERWPGVFRGETLSDGLTVYSLRGPTPPLVHPLQTRFLTGDMPPGARSIGRPAGEAILAAARLEAATAQRGGDVDVELFWSPAGERRPAKYVVSIRLDHTEPALPLGGRPFPKLTRKIREKIGGRRFRARSDHMIAGGFQGPDAWPAGVIVRDPVRLRVPSDLSPGRYTLRAKLLRLSHVPNERLHDFFFDDDRYHGVEFGRIVVE